MVNNTEPCGTPDVTGRLCVRESPTQTCVNKDVLLIFFMYSM